MVVEIAGIDDNDQCVGAALAFKSTEDNVAGNRFVEAVGFKTISTGKVDQFNGASVGKGCSPRFALYGDAGIVGNFLAGASERIEQRALPGIGIADQRD